MVCVQFVQYKIITPMDSIYPENIKTNVSTLVCVCVCVCWFWWITRTFHQFTYQHYKDIWDYGDKGHVLVIQAM